MPDPLVVTTMNAFKADLLRQETTQMAAMARRWRQTEAALIDQVELFARRVADDKLSRAQLQDAQYMLDRSQSLLRQARAEFDKYVRYAGPLIETRQRQLGEQGIQHAEAAINAVGTEAGVEIGFSRLPVAAVENMVGLAGDNSPLTTLLESKYGDGVDGMFTELIRATALGKNPRETAQRMVREGFSQSLTQMMVIARTEQLRVYREAARQAYQESGVVEAFRRLATRDNRACAGCLFADGEYYELRETLREHAQGRCSIIPSVEGFPEAQWQKGPDWFVEQSPETQTKILGPGRYAAWKDGLFDLDQLMTLRTNATWGDSVQPTSLTALLNGTAQRYNVQRELPNPFSNNTFTPPPWVTGASATVGPKSGQVTPTPEDLERARLAGEQMRREQEMQRQAAAEKQRMQMEREAAARVNAARLAAEKDAAERQRLLTNDAIVEKKDAGQKGEYQGTIFFEAIRGKVKRDKKSGLFPVDELRKEARKYIAANQATGAENKEIHGMAGPENFSAFTMGRQTIYYNNASKAAAEDFLAYGAIYMERTNATIPPRLLDSTKDIVFSSQLNQQDDYNRVRLNNPNHVSEATGGDGNIAVYGARSLPVGTYIHEMGHNTAFRLYGQTTPSQHSAYGRIVDAGIEPAVSRYAQNNPSEDFAEAVREYIENPQGLKANHPQRYAVIDQIIRTGNE